MVGFSWGAHWALWLSLVRPGCIAAVTVYYGTRNVDYSQASAASLGHFAQADDWVAASGVHKLEKSLRAASRSIALYTYEGCGHWFCEEDQVDAYQPEAARLAW